MVFGLSALICNGPPGMVIFGPTLMLFLESHLHKTKESGLSYNNDGGCCISYEVQDSNINNEQVH